MGTVSDAQWALLAPRLGANHWVEGAGDLTPSVVSASARIVRIGAGAAGGRGVRDVLDTPVDVTLDPLGSGTRIDIVVLRRSWTPASTPTGTTRVEIVSAPTLTAALGARRSQPGTTAGDDQPLAAFQVTVAGEQTTVSLVADLRVWAANGGMAARSTDALVAVSSPGTMATVDGVLWVMTVDSSGASSWVRMASPVDRTAPQITLGAGATGISGVVCRRTNGMLWLRLNFTSAHWRSAGLLDLGSTLFTLPAGFRPASQAAFSTAHGLHGPIEPTGAVAIQYNGPPVAAGSPYWWAATYAVE